MTEESDLLAERREKLERLRKAGVEPFPHGFPDRAEIAAVREPHEGIESGRGDRAIATGSPGGCGPPRARQGRLPRPRDGTGQIQLHARADVLGDAYEACSTLDLGDIIGIEGRPSRSKRGELSIRADAWELLAKSLRPPPDKFHGLEDIETRYRRRELDLMANEETPRTIPDAGPAPSPRSAAGWTTEASWRSRPRCSSRSTAVRWPGRSPPTTTRSTGTSICGSRPSSTSSAAWSAASRRSTSSARTSVTRAYRSSTTPSSRCSSGTRPTRTTRRRATELEGLVAEVAQAVLGTTKIERDGGDDRALSALAARHAAGGDPRGDRHRHAGAPHP